MMVGEKQEKWFAVDIEVLPEAAEAVEHLFSVLDAAGIETDLMPRSADRNIKITGYFNEVPAGEIIDSELNAALGIYGHERSAIVSISSREVVSSDWLAEWKKHWKPTVVGKFVIAPPWDSVDEGDKIVIRIEPNMAFGTGTHETTQLCLEAISHNYRSGQTFLDVGTGTGILAIAAAKLSGESTEEDERIEILACDNDGDSVKIAAENAILNGVGDSIEFVLGALADNAPQFDFVCANLTVDVIVPLLSLLLEKSRTTLVLSGILVEQREIIERELRKFQVSNYEIRISGEWIAVIISME